MKLLRNIVLCFLLGFHTLSLANKNEDVSDALIAEFYLQNNEPDQAYLAYQDLIKTQPTQALAERILYIANLTKNKNWQQKSLGELLKFKQYDLKLGAQYLLTFINQKQSKIAKKKLAIFFRYLKKATKDDYELYASLAIVLSQASNTKVATALIQDYVNNNSVASLNGVALYHRLLKQYKTATKYLRKSLKMAPNLDQTLVIFSDVLYSKGEKSAAIYLLEQKLTQIKSVKLSTILASLLVRDKKYKKSIEIYKKLIVEDVKNANKWRKILSSVYLVLGKPKLSENILLKLLNIKEYKDYANYSLGLIAEEENRPKKAKYYYQQVKNGDYYFRSQKRLVTLIAITNKKIALMLIDNINISRLEDYIDLLMLKINIYETYKEWQNAYDTYTHAISLQPTANLYYNRALLLEKMGKIDLMNQDLLKIIENNPKNYDALNALGYSLSNYTNRYKEAKSYIKRALLLKPKAFYILDSMGWVWYKLGNFKLAIKYFKKALKVKQDAEVAAHLALVLKAAGQNNESNKYMLQAMSLDKNNPVVIKILKEINRYNKY